jgi:hypothetical protein
MISASPRRTGVCVKLLVFDGVRFGAAVSREDL